MFSFNLLLSLFFLVATSNPISTTGEPIKVPKLRQLNQKDLEVPINPMEKNGKWGFADEKGKFIIKPVFSSVKPFSNQRSWVEIDGLWGVLNRDASYLFEPQFDSYTDFNTYNEASPSIAVIEKKGKFGLINSVGETVLKPEFEEINEVRNDSYSVLDEGLYVVKKNYQYGLFDCQRGKMTIPDEYDAIDSDSFYEYGYFVLRQGGKKGICRSDGYILSECLFDFVYLVTGRDYHDSSFCFLVQRDDKYDFLGPRIELGSPLILRYHSPSIIGFSQDLKKSKTDRIINGIAVSVINNSGESELFDLKGKRHPIRNPTAKFINGGAIIKDNDGKYYILYNGRLLSYEDYNREMKKNDYSQDSILPEWARLYSSGKEEISSSKPIASLDGGTLILRYESINLGYECDFGGYGITDSKGNWIVKPVLIMDQVKTAGSYTIYPCDEFKSAIFARYDKFGRFGDTAHTTPFVFNSYDEATKYSSVKLKDSNYYAIIRREPLDNGYQVYGYADKNSILIQPQYYCYYFGGETDSGYDIDTFSSSLGYAVVKIEPKDFGKEVVINLKNEVVGPPEGVDPYDYKRELEDNYRNTLLLARVREKQNSYWGYINQYGQEVIPEKYSEAKDFKDGFAQVCLGGIWGFINKEGEEVIPLKYGYAESFSEGRAAVRELGGRFDSNTNKKWAYIDESGKSITKFIYQTAYSFEDGMAMVLREGRYGFINKSGEEIIPCFYLEAHPFSDGLAAIQRDGLWGYINKNGQIVIPCKYSIAHDFHDGRALVKENGSYAFIDKQGSIISQKSFPSDYRVASSTEGLFMVYSYRDMKHGFFDKNFKEVIPRIYKTLDDFHEGFAYVSESGDDGGFINKDGEVIFPFVCEHISRFSEGKAAIRRDGRWGYIDKLGNEIVLCTYISASDFSNGFGRVANYNGYYGFVNETGELVIPCKYTDAGDFK